MRSARFVLGATIISSSFLLRVSSFVVNQGSARWNSISATRRWSSVSEKGGEEVTQHWENLYYQDSMPSSMEEESFSMETPASEVRVVTFDLDNTLWKTGATISAANDALKAFLDEEKIIQPKRVEKIMGELFRADKSRYSPLSDDPKSPVLLTMLRKDAIQYILEEHNNCTVEQSTEFADKAFDVWINARYASIPSHFAESVVPCLERIRSLSSVSTGSPILVGAITDGNSDPRQVPVLNSYFDFVVNAEGVGISKPDKRVYMSAMTQVASHPSMQDMFGHLQDRLTPEVVEDTVGPWWVHIGDDFTKDIVAAKDLSMRTIWVRELVLDKMKLSGDISISAEPEKTQLPPGTTTNNAVVEAQQPTKKNRTVQDLVKDISEMKVVEMSVGADDYLLEGLQAEFADAIVDKFDELSTVLFKWHERASQENEVDDIEDEIGTNDASPESVTSGELPLSVTMPDEAVVAVESSTETKTKFCMFCGEKLLYAAKFCSSCGEKQPEIN